MPWWGCGTCNEPNDDNITVLDYNHLSLEEVPDDIFQFERTLEELYLDSNHIQELPRQLFHCHELKVLNLHDNDLTVIPSAISSLENLQWLDLAKNSLTVLPQTIKSCNNLQHLNLSLNPIEKIGDPITSMLALTELYLNDTYLEFLPANFGRLTNLRILELRENGLITLPKSMNRLENLTRLDIGQNEFTELPEVVSHLLNLTELWMDSNQIRRFPANIGQLRKLLHVEASNNRLSSLPRHIGYWTKVIELCLNKNELTELPPTIGNIKTLVSLKVEENRLRTLPESICKLSSLEELMLIQNSLEALPDSIGLLRKLQVLTVDKNLLTMLPIEIGSCTSLRVLSLRSNCVTHIPAELGQLSNLRVLNLVDNDLRELPVSLLKLTKLAALWLSNNQSQPLMPLQQDYNPETRQTFLTCLLLPQRDSNPTESLNNNDSNQTISRRHIYFAPEPRNIQAPQKLSRAPTPYPKELRALARHARSMQRGLSLVPSEPSPDLEKTDLKEAANVSTQQPPVTKVEVGIKEAKNVRMPKRVVRSPDESESSGSLIMQPSQPPPYYIAAAQSQHAEYFQNILKRPIGNSYFNQFDQDSAKFDQMSLNSVDTLITSNPPPQLIQDQPQVGRNNHIVMPTPQRIQTTYSFPPNSQPESPPQQPRQVWHDSPQNGRWLFGNHRNPFVIQVQIRKTSPEIGFRVTQVNNGIVVSEIIAGSCAENVVRPGDKILDVDNIYDFTKINVDSANRILQNSGPIVNMMISRT